MSTETVPNELKLTLDEALQATNGQLIEGQAPGPVTLTRVSTDTRSLQAGDCFFALRGESFDAHNFLDQAAAAGAGLLFVERHVPDVDVPQVLVQDTLVALGQLANTWRSRFSLPVVALAGSSGKTTTKEMAAEIVAADRSLLVTKGNLNNLIGLPQMLFSLNDTHESAVLEIGMNVPDENRRLVEMADPDCILLTNITHAHVGMFGSLEAHYEAEAEAIRYAPERATLIFNADDPKSRQGREQYAGGRKVLTFGVEEAADLKASEIEPLEPYGYCFKLHGLGFEGEQVNLVVFGRHNVSNATAAAVIGRYLGVPVPTIVAALNGFKPRLNRSEVEQINGWYLIKDYYNSIPSAVQLALGSLADFKVPGRRFALLGDMMELGDFEREFHEQVGESAASAGLHRLYTLGERGRIIHESARAKGVDAMHLPDIETAAAELKANLTPGDLLLLKGSRLLRLERLYELLKP